MINFKAAYIGPSNIQVQNRKGVWTDKSASFIQIAPQYPRDFLALGKTATMWYRNNNTKPTLASSIYCDAALEWSDNIYEYYALTEQTGGFEKLIPEKILGLVEVRPMQEDLHEIVFLQVDPRKNYKKFGRNVKHIGKSIIDSIIEHFPRKDIILEPAAEALDFYLKYGFKPQIMSRQLRYYV